MAKPEGEKAKLILPDGREIELPCHRSTMGSDTVFIDIQSLHSQGNAFTYDPGFTCTASCASAITYLDGGKGECFYRGYPVADLCRHYDYMDVAFLLLNDQLPDADQRESFVSAIEENML